MFSFPLGEEIVARILSNNKMLQEGCGILLLLLNISVLGLCGTKAIEGIVHNYSEYNDGSKELSFATETFKRMSRLRFYPRSCISFWKL